MPGWPSQGLPTLHLESESRQHHPLGLAVDLTASAECQPACQDQASLQAWPARLASGLANGEVGFLSLLPGCLQL